MCSRALIFVALALLVCGSVAAGTGRPLLQTTSASAVSVATSNGGGPVSATTKTTAENGATVRAKTVVTSGPGAGPVTGITVAEGSGNVEIDRRTVINAAGEEAKGTVAVFVKKVEDGATKEVIEQDFIIVLGKAEPFVFVRTLALGLLETGPIKLAAIAAAESLLEERGCEDFRRPFLGFSLPIARIEGGCGPTVNACIFDKCPTSCCTDAAKAAKTCGCTGDVCPWVKGSFSKTSYTPFFWKCKDCQAPADSCICA